LRSSHAHAARNFGELFLSHWVTSQDNAITRTIVVPPHRAYQSASTFTVSVADGQNDFRRFIVAADNTDVTWKSIGDGSGTARLEISANVAGDPTVSLDLAETWTASDRSKQTERRTTLTLPKDASRDLYAFLKTLFEPESTCSETVLSAESLGAFGLPQFVGAGRDASR
jgi:hypothetical protein